MENVILCISRIVTDAVLAHSNGLGISHMFAKMLIKAFGKNIMSCTGIFYMYVLLCVYANIE